MFVTLKEPINVAPPVGSAGSGGTVLQVLPAHAVVLEVRLYVPVVYAGHAAAICEQLLL